MILKKTYEKLYSQIGKQFDTTLKKMPFDLFQEIENDFIRENYELKDLTNLDKWVSFYFKNGRFPGNQELTILPQTQLPKLIDQLSVEVSPVELYKKFGNGDNKPLVSFQAIIALFLYYGGEPITAKRAMDEWKENLTFQALSKENDKVTIKFEYLAEIVFYFLRAFLTLESEFEEHEKLKLEISTRSINSSNQIQNLQTSTPISRPRLSSIFYTSDSMNENDSEFLKTSFRMAQPNLDASIEAAEEKNREIIRSIIDPTPGFVVDEKITDDDLNKRNEDESKPKLGNAAQKRFDDILDNINKSIETYKIDSNIQFKPSIDKTKKHFSVEKEKENIEMSKSTQQTKISTVRKKEKRSPYKLRSKTKIETEKEDRKRKRNQLESELTFKQPYFYQTINDENTNKIKAAETVIESIVKQLPEHRKKMKFTLDASNDIKLTEL